MLTINDALSNARSAKNKENKTIFCVYFMFKLSCPESTFNGPYISYFLIRPFEGSTINPF